MSHSTSRLPPRTAAAAWFAAAAAATATTTVEVAPAAVMTTVTLAALASARSRWRARAFSTWIRIHSKSLRNTPRTLIRRRAVYMNPSHTRGASRLRLSDTELYTRPTAPTASMKAGFTVSLRECEYCMLGAAAFRFPLKVERLKRLPVTALRYEHGTIRRVISLYVSRRYYLLRSTTIKS